MKLKTLKDMECKGETHGFRERWISETELKAEAVKWVKKNFNKDWSDNDLNYLDWMEFFNITEEDLK